MSEFDFGSLLPEEEKKTPTPAPTPVRRTSTPRKPKKDNTKLIMDFSRVVSCIHVNIHKTHRNTLTEIVGSYVVADVRKYLTDKLVEALQQ